MKVDSQGGKRQVDAVETRRFDRHCEFVIGYVFRYEKDVIATGGSTE